MSAAVVETFIFRRPLTAAELRRLTVGGELPFVPLVGRRYRFRYRANRAGDRTVPHGTPGGYHYHRCSCGDCRRANRDLQRCRRARHRRTNRS